MKTYYYIYQITNLVNNKIYVGVHKTSDLNDDYMGSGKVIKSSIEKYGIDNFKKDILEYFEDSESMYAREKEIVTDEFLLREDTYNLRRGGTGGFDYINKNELNGTLEGRQKSADIYKKRLIIDDKFREMDSKLKSDRMKIKHQEDKSIRFTKEQNKIYSEKARESNINTIFINNGKVNKRLKNHLPIPEGWKKGRLIK